VRFVNGVLDAVVRAPAAPSAPAHGTGY
jgi:hypothetical protein